MDPQIGLIKALAAEVDSRFLRYLANIADVQALQEYEQAQLAYSEAVKAMRDSLSQQFRAYEGSNPNA